ncbi:MAG: hypothetical protein ACO3RM_11040 [Paracoccaceae bacterium]|jgi:hypothetical protein
MAKYLETFTHTFDNSDDMYEHLRRDTLNFAKIEEQLKRAGMISATQYVSEGSDEYKHIGQLLCENKGAHDACMAIMNSHDWDAEIPKQTSFETFQQYA